MNRIFSRAVLALFVASTLLVSRGARADDPLSWKWKRFRPAEVAFTSGLALNAAMLVLVSPQPTRNWDGGILFDDAARDAMRVRTVSGRRTAADVSDALYYGLLAYPILVDGLAVTAIGHGRGDTALQMIALNLEAQLFTGVLAMSAEKLGRTRPMISGCESDPKYDARCDDKDRLNTSFASGHTAIAFAGAGLICSHHRALPLYGGGAADVIACIGGLTAATAGGVLRVLSDNHYASDVIIGAGLGILGGYVLPSVLHYGFGARSIVPVVQKGSLAAAFAPRITTESLGIAVSGSF